MIDKTKYQAIYDTLETTIRSRNERGIYTAMGYSSNLDILLDFHVEELNQLLEKHMSGADLGQMRRAEWIRTVPELLETIVWFCLHGVGGEVDIEDPALIRSCFPCKNGVGGTAVQAAMALSQVGAESVVHLTDDSPELCEQLVSPYICVPLEDGSLGHADEVQPRNEQEVHVILQFQKGNEIRLGDQTAVIPASNRLILTKNTVNVTVPFRDSYFRWIEDHAKQVSSNVLSSFNCILDPAVLKERLEYVKHHIEVYHQRNPEGTVYFEDAHYHDADVRRLCIETLYPLVDIMSMNEEELAYTLKMYDVPVDIEDVLSCVRGVEYLLHRFRIHKGIVVHTKDYAMFVGDRGQTDIEKGLVWGGCLATAKAAFGGYGSDLQIREILKNPLSEKGVRSQEILAESEYKDQVILVPTCYIDKPKYTIGLGDSFTGGMQLCF